MKETKTLYWLLVVIGLLSILASVYLYIAGKPFDKYFISGAMGLIIAVLGFVNIRKINKNKA